jgi:hypothetical protein
LSALYAPPAYAFPPARRRIRWGIPRAGDGDEASGIGSRGAGTPGLVKEHTLTAGEGVAGAAVPFAGTVREVFATKEAVAGVAAAGSISAGEDTTVALAGST